MIAFIAFLACVVWFANALHTPTSAEIWYAEGQELGRERRRKEREEHRKKYGSPWKPLWISFGSIALVIIGAAVLMRQH